MKTTTDLSEARKLIEDLQKQKVFGITPLTTLFWARERLANSKRIMGTKTGTELRGWQEDAAYWEDIVSQMEALPAALRALLELVDLLDGHAGDELGQCQCAMCAHGGQILAAFVGAMGVTQS